MMQTAQHPRNDDEDLSALVDGELSDELALAMLKRLGADAAERARLTEYFAVGDALRGLSSHAPDLTLRVMAALEDEPTVLAPLRKARTHHPYLWLAAATVTAIAWGVWSVDPKDPAGIEIATAPANQPESVTPYLAAHQDYAQALVYTPEMSFTRVNLAEIRR
jgi:negative regulator of sigma E activity